MVKKKKKEIKNAFTVEDQLFFRTFLSMLAPVAQSVLRLEHATAELTGKKISLDSMLSM